MDRRTYLAAIAGGTALLGGCTVPAAEQDQRQHETPSSSSPEDEPARASDGDAEPLADDPTVVDFETASLSAAVVGGYGSTADRLTLEIDFDTPATTESPARLGARISNGRPFAQTFSPRRLVVLDDPPSGRDESRNAIYLVPTAEHALAETVPEISRDDDGRWRVDSVADDWFPDTVTLEADEWIDLEYALVGHHDRGEPPIQTGTYRFLHGDVAFSIAVWPTDEPGPTEPSRFADADVPPIPDTETAWYHEAGPETTTFLRPDVESVEAPAKVEFDLVNRARAPVSGNPYRWRLWKLVDGEWYPVDPWMWNMPLASVTPGDIDETELRLYHGDPIPDRGSRTVGHLGGGRYAYTVGYSHDDEIHAAMVDLEAPALEVEPESDATIEREGETVVVRLPNHDDARRPSTVAVTRAADADERLVEEQLPRRPFRAFRNTLPFFERGVEKVVLQTNRSTALQPVDYDDGGTRTVEYDGDAFEATGRVLEEDG